MGVCFGGISEVSWAGISYPQSDLQLDWGVIPQAADIGRLYNDFVCWIYEWYAEMGINYFEI